MAVKNGGVMDVASGGGNVGGAVVAADDIGVIDRATDVATDGNAIEDAKEEPILGEDLGDGSRCSRKQHYWHRSSHQGWWW